MTAPDHVDACDGFNACTLLRDAVRVSERGVADVECDLCASCRKLPGQAAKAGRSEIVVHIEAVPGGGVSRDGREEGRCSGALDSPRHERCPETTNPRCEVQRGEPSAVVLREDAAVLGAVLRAVGPCSRARNGAAGLADPQDCLHRASERLRTPYLPGAGNESARRSGAVSKCETGPDTR